MNFKYSFKNFSKSLSLTTVAFLIFIVSIGYITLTRRNYIKNPNGNYLYSPTMTQKVNCGDHSYVHQHPFEVISEREATPADLKIVNSFDVFSHIKSLLNDYEISEFSYTSGYQQIAYIKRDYNSAYPRESTAKVFLTSSPYNEKDVIFSLKPTYFENHDYSINLRDVGFSSDGKLLAITTSDSLFLYNTETKDIRNLFTKKYDLKQGIGGVFSYYSPVFSPDNSKILLYKGFYEGRGALVYDLVQGKIIDLPYTIYGHGENVVDWQDDKLLVYKSDYRGNNEVKSLVLLNLPDLSEKLLFESEYLDSNATFVNGKYYAISEMREEADIKVCDNNGNLWSPQKNTQYLYSFDVVNGEAKELLVSDATAAWGGVEIQSVTADISGKIYVQLDHDNSRTEVYELNTHEPNKLIRLKRSL